MNSHDDILIGTVVPAADCASYIRQIIPNGFESFQITFGKAVGEIDLKAMAREVKQVLQENGRKAVISSIGIYGNPLVDKETANDFKRLIKAAELFDCKLVCGFAGRIIDRPVPESMPAYKKIFAPLAKLAEDEGVRIAFENCDMKGTWTHGNWNIAHAPTAWEMMFNEVPSEAIGLEWEPCHQMVSLIDPIPQLRKWVDRVYHVHGKDATIQWDVIRTYGIRGGKSYVAHRTPGFGDTNWHDIISILRQGKFRGSIDIEGWHDPVYRGDLEMTGQVHGLQYLKFCRGGDFIPNPVVKK